MAEIEFGTFATAEKVNPYTEVVKQLNESADPNAAVILTVEAKDSLTEQLKFQKAANSIGKTARLREKDESEISQGPADEDGLPTINGNVKLTFTLTKMHKGRRGKNNNGAEKPADINENEEVFVEDAVA